MNIIKPSARLLQAPGEQYVMKRLEAAGRVCYKSEERITSTSAKPFVAAVIKRGHESVIEHISFTAKFVVDRGVSHEIVRHRLASYSQESTRYCNYGNTDGAITVILPCFFDTGMGEASNSHAYNKWKFSCEAAEDAYLDLIGMGATPQEARSVLPNSLKTEVIMTANAREWRHFFKMRAAAPAHPQMRQVALQLLKEMVTKYPVLFESCVTEYVREQWREPTWR